MICALWPRPDITFNQGTSRNATEKSLQQIPGFYNTHFHIWFQLRWLMWSIFRCHRIYMLPLMKAMVKNCTYQRLYCSLPLDFNVWDQEPDGISRTFALRLWESEQCVCPPAGVPPECLARTVECPAPAGLGRTARKRKFGWRRNIGSAQTPGLVAATRASSLHISDGAPAGLPPYPVPEQNGPLSL